MKPIVRAVGAETGTGPARLVVSGIDDLEALRTAWAASGASVTRLPQRLDGASTVEALARAAFRCLPEAEAVALERAARAAAESWSAPTPALAAPALTPPALTTSAGELPLDRAPAVMGVVNVTPDSFHDGGATFPDDHPEAAVALGRRLAAEGATILDVGGESTRPGADPVDEAEELRRVVPVVEGLVRGGGHPAPIVSIDTTKPEVARQAVAAGAGIVNDVSGGPPALLEAVAETGAAYVLMHRRGTPRDMQQHTDYEDVVAEVFEALAAGLERCSAAGVPVERIAVDPGIGFAKTVEQNLELLRAVPQLRSLGRPVLIGASRKSFIGALLDGAPTDDRLEGSLACAALATAAGAGILRVHDVLPTVRVVRVASAISPQRSLA